MSLNTQRRALLQLLLLAAATPVSALGILHKTKFTTSPFWLGVASGSPASDGFVLWTRLLSTELTPDQAVLVDWEVFELDRPNHIVATGQHAARPELAHSVHVEVSGLRADSWYGYRFRAGGFESVEGRTRTLPAAGAMPSRLRFAYASCQKWEAGFYAAYRHMRREELDLVVFVGDYIYEGGASKDPASVRTHALPRARNLADYRARYALYKSDVHLQNVHAACPWLITWDDHEVENDYAGRLSTRGTKDFEARRIAAYQAFYEHMPLRTSTMVAGLRGLRVGAELRIYQRVDFGRLAAFHILDDRQYRDAPLCPLDPKPRVEAVCNTTKAPRSLLGTAQEAWLADSFASSAGQGTVWNIITQQTRFTPANYVYGPDKKMSIDNWDGYSDARLRLLQSMKLTKLSNPVIVGGDIHQNWVARVHEDPYNADSPLLASEFCGTSISSTSSSTLARARRLAAANPHCLLVNPEKRGYGVVEITHDKARIQLQVLDDVRDENSGLTTLAVFQVDNGRFVRRVDT